jgi:DNA-binding NarL/FixJ family response regulator
MEAALRLIAQEITVAIVRHEAIARDGLTALLAQHDDFSVVASVAQLGASELGEADPSILLVEVEVANENTDALTRPLARGRSRAKVIVTGVSPDNCDVMAFVRAGVAGFVIKDASLSDLAAAIRSVASGAQVMPPELIESVSRNAGFGRSQSGKAGGASLFDRITPRERQITLLIANGKCNKDIAERIFISNHTVKAHVRNIMEKLGLHSRLQIAARANQERWRLMDEDSGDEAAAAGREALA